MNFQVSHLDSIVDENPSNEFDLLFSMPVGQMILNSEVSSSSSSFSNMKPANENQLNSSECPVCDENFSDDHNLTTHLLEHSFCTDGQEEKVNSSIEQRDSFQCQICTVNFASNGRLNFHKKTIHHLKTFFRCFNNQCSQIFEEPVDYIIHATIHNQKLEANRKRKMKNRCTICKRNFPNAELLENHLNNEQHEFSCQTCSATFLSANDYHNHLAHHQDRIPVYHCDLCEESFEKRTDLSKHRSTVHENHLLKEKFCSTCKLTFKTTFHLNRHNISKHSDSKPFKCEEQGCQQAFARKDKLKQHAAKHAPNDRMLKCDICVKTFVRPEHLRDHRIVRHSHKFPFRCEYCRKGFLHPNQLYTHHKQRHPKENAKTTEEQTISSTSDQNLFPCLSTTTGKI